MTSPARGRADYWKPGDWNALCYQCGRKRKAGEMMRYWQGYWLCPEHWEPRQPQDFVRGVTEQPAPPWVQPPGLLGIPLLFENIDTSATTYEVTVSTETVAAVNDTVIVVTIDEGVYIGTLDLSGVPTGWTVQLNNFGGVGTIIGTATVRSGPPDKPLPSRSVVISSGTNVDVYTQTLLQWSDAATHAGRYTVTIEGEIQTLTWDVGHLFPSGCGFDVVNTAKVYGLGGDGGTGGRTSPPYSGGDGTDGEDAIDLNGHTITLNNSGGQICGGGGGGGGGSAPVDHDAEGGGGGGGAGFGIGGLGATLGFPVNATDGNDGDLVTFGNGGVGTQDGFGNNGGAGGAGGAFGEDGDAGGTSTPTSAPAAAGGLAGKAIKLSGGAVTFTSVGTIKGDIS